jgi:hypothetical protein
VNDKETRSMAALTYVWGMADAIYDVERGKGDIDRYSALQGQALEFSKWYAKDTDHPVGLIRRAYSVWLRNPA